LPDVPRPIALGRGLVVRTPVLVASGTFGYGFEQRPRVDFSCLGAICSKGTTLRPRAGSAPVRIVETPAGMLNAIGLHNPGVDVVVRDYARQWRQWEVPVLVNIAGETIAEYVEIARRLDGVAGVAGIELNISCPNMAAGGIQFGVDPELAAQVTAAVRRVTTLHVMVKLAPNAPDVVTVARAVESAGADSISAVNTYVGMAFDVESGRPVLANITGGLSGPAIRPLAVHLVYRVAAAVNIPVIGIGGIRSARDALEFLVAGAVAVQVGTANYIDPKTPETVLEGIREHLRRRGLLRTAELHATVSA
jgi:dihydroorotate dehydrogenase (NAD+) catalytic subunit